MIHAERPLDLLEAAYRLDGTDDEWVGHLAERLGSILPEHRLGVIGFLIYGKVDASGRSVISRLGPVRGTKPFENSQDLRGRIASHGEFPAELQARLYFSPFVAETTSVISGLGRALPNDEKWKQGRWDPAIKDGLGLIGHAGPLSSVVLSIALDEVTTLTPPARRLWQRIAAHVGAAARLRQSSETRPERADVVLSPSGKIERLTPGADDHAAKEAFAVRRHARRGRTTSEAALEIWQGLHQGRWSLVDYLDTDGKAFVLAVRNEPARDAPSTLTDRQRATVALAALGYGNKQIAYALGLTAAAVAMLLARARIASGCRTRADLVRAFKRTLAEQSS